MPSVDNDYGFQNQDAQLKRDARQQGSLPASGEARAEALATRQADWWLAEIKRRTVAYLKQPGAHTLQPLEQQLKAYQEAVVNNQIKPLDPTRRSF